MHTDFHYTFIFVTGSHIIQASMSNFPNRCVFNLPFASLSLSLLLSLFLNELKSSAAVNVTFIKTFFQSLQNFFKLKRIREAKDLGLLLMIASFSKAMISNINRNLPFGSFDRSDQHIVCLVYNFQIFATLSSIISMCQSLMITLL